MFYDNLYKKECTIFVYSVDCARTHLANDAKAAKNGGERQFSGLGDVYRKSLHWIWHCWTLKRI